MGNNLNIELKDKYVILDKKYFKGTTDIERMFLCSGGFGCNADTMGSALFGHFTLDGEECRVDGYQVQRLATPEEIAQANYPKPLSPIQKLERQKERLMKKKAEIQKCIDNINLEILETKTKVKT